MTRIEKVVGTIKSQVEAKCRGEWNEEYCWYYLRQMFPTASDEQLGYYADRIQLAMR